MTAREKIFRDELRTETAKRDEFAARLFVADIIVDALSDFVWYEFESTDAQRMIDEGCPQTRAL